MGFLMAALMCFNLLAWPLFSLGFPLYASVRAIETNSMQEMRAVVAYWILISLISIFELAFGKLIQWLPFWPYIKLISICWMVLPRFNGACYVYEHMIHRWLSVNPQELVNLIVRPKKNTSLDAERVLSMAEKFVKENGCEALEKLIAGKPEHRNPDGDMEEIKAVTNTEEKGTAAAMPSPPKVPNVAKENAKAGELREKDLAATERSHPKGPDVAKENAKAGEVMKKDLAAIERVFVPRHPCWSLKDRPKELDMAKENAKAGEEKDKDPVATERVKSVEPNLAQTEKNTVSSGEIKEKTAPAEKPVMEELASWEKVQREWTCAVCQFTTSSEQNLSSHLPGMKHEAKCEELKASKNNNGSSSTSGWEHKKANSGDNPSPSKPKKQEYKVKVKQDRPKELDMAKENAKAWEEKEKNPVATETVKYVEPNLAQTKKKTVASWEIKEETAPAKEQVMEELASSKKVGREWICPVSQVTTSCKQDFRSHLLRGKKCEAKCEELKASKNDRGSSSSSGREHKKANYSENPSPSKPKKQEYRVKVTGEAAAGKTEYSRAMV